MSTILDRHRETLESKPDDRLAFEALQEHYFLEGDWDQLIALYRYHLAAPALQNNAERRRPILFRLAQVLEERCDRIDDALETYWEVARLDPQFRPSLRQLRHIYTVRCQWDMVLQTAELEGQLEMAPIERAEFLADMGGVWLEHLEDAAEAFDCFERSVEADPHQKRGLAGLARTHEIFGRAAQAAALNERLVEELRGPDRSPVLVALGKLYAGPLADLERATACFRRAMTDDPRCDAAVESLLVIASAQEQWHLLGDLYERRFNLASGARHRSAIALEAGNMHLNRIGDREAARTWFQRAHELAAEDITVHHAQAELDRAEGDRVALMRTLDHIIDLARDTVAIGVLLEAAELHSQAGNADKAVEYLELAQIREPGDPLVLEALSEALANTDRKSDLASVLEARVALDEADPDAQAEALCELGRLYEQELDDPEAAVQALERAFQIAPGAPGLHAALERNYRKTERWSDLRQLLERTLEHAVLHGDSETRSRLGCALGQLLVEQIGEPDAARASFEAVLELAPDDARALQGLERLARDSGDQAACLAFFEREAATTQSGDRLAELIAEMVPLFEEGDELERALFWTEKLLETQPEHRGALEDAARLQRALGDEPALLASLRRLDPHLSGAEQARGRRKIAELERRLDNPDAATVAYEAALESDPNDVISLRALADEYRAGHRVQDLARVLRRMVDAVPPEQAGVCLDQLARLLDEDLGDSEAAIVVLWRLVGLPDAPPDAEERLESLLERAGRFEELAQQLVERRRHLPEQSPETDAIDLRRAYLLMDKLGQLEQAASLFRAIRSRNPGSREATEGLEQALRSGDDSAGLALLLESRARTTADPEARAAIVYERAMLLEEALGDQEAASLLYVELADAEPATSVSEQAGVRIEHVLERRGDWSALRERLEGQLERANPAVALALRERLATICRDRLADLDGAIMHLEAIGATLPERSATWRDLASLYGELERHADLLRVMRTELACTSDPDRELVLHACSARLCLTLAEARNDDTLFATAREHYERVLEIDPSHTDASEFLIDHYTATGNDADVARLLESRLVHAEGRNDDEGAISLRLRLAAIHAEQLGELGSAIQILLPAEQRIGPVNPVAGVLADLYQRAGDDEALVDLCRRATTASDNADDRASWLVRLGESLCRAGRPREAADAYCAALADRPGSRDIERVLIDLYRELEDASPLATLLEVEIDRTDRETAIPLRIELAVLLAGPLDRGHDALAHLQGVLEIDPDHRAAFDLAMQLSQSLNRQDEILGLLDRRLEALTSSAERATLLERRGTLLAGTLDRPEEAASAFREAVALEPSRATARQALLDVMVRLERWTAVLDCLHLEARETEGAERIAVLERAVEIARDHLSGDATLPWLERLRVESPDDADVPARMACVHRSAGRPEALLRALEIQLSLTSEPAACHDLQIDRAGILDRDLQSPARAIAAYETARELQPDSTTALEALDRLYDLTGRVHERVEILEARIAHADADDRIALQRDAAVLCAAGLADHDRAIPHLLGAVSLARERGVDAGIELELIRELGETLRAAGRVDAWVRACEAEIAILPDATPEDRRRAAELHQELASTYRAELGLPDASLSHLLALLELDERARVRGESLLPADRAARVEAELVSSLRASRNHFALAERLATGLERGDGDADTWLELAQLQAESLHAPARAKHAYNEVLALRPDCLPAIRGLRHVAECLGDWSEVARALELEIGLPDRWSPHELAALRRRLGDVCAHRLDARQRGADAYRACLDALPGQIEPLRSLEQLLKQLEIWPELADRYEQEIALLDDDDPERRSTLWLEVARLCEELDDDARKLHAYEQAAKLGRLDARDQRAWSDLYRAADDHEHFADTFMQWCDDPEAEASSWDHLALVGTLRALGRSDAALARAERATEVDPTIAEAWDTLAELREQSGDPSGALDAWVRAAEQHAPRTAAERLIHAASLCTDDAHAQAATLLRQATVQDPGFAAAHARLAEVAERLGEHAEAETAAARALDLAATDDSLTAAERRETGLIGGRAAQAQEHLDHAADFFGGVLEIDTENIEALDGRGAVLFARGDYRGAQKLMETRLELDADDPERATHLAMVGRGLEQAGEDGAAMSRYREALGVNRALAQAHEGIVRLHDRAGDAHAAITALRARINSEVDPALRAQAHLDVAERLATDGQVDSALSHLRDAVADHPALEMAWLTLCRLLGQAGRDDAVLETSASALEHVEDLAMRAEIALLRARILDAENKPSQAVEAYAEAVAGDRCCVEAALAQGRLLRGMGDWSAAAEALERFAGDHPVPNSIELAQVYLDWGRLMAGPLESVERAIHCYERALDLDPTLVEAREPLAALLAHVPDRWEDAVRSHAALLAQEPTRQPSLRALLEIARRRNLEDASDTGLALLRALGSTTPEESSIAPGNLGLQIEFGGRLEDPVWETARRICNVASQEIADAIGHGDANEASDPNVASPTATSDPLDLFQSLVAAEETRLTAPGITDLDTDALDSLVYTVTALAADPGGNCNDGPYLHALDEGLGRWVRRKIRKALGDVSIRQIQAIDYTAWREALRDLAVCAALNAEGDLRAALVSLSIDTGVEPSMLVESADLCAVVAGAPRARRLLSRVITAWKEQLLRSR